MAINQKLHNTKIPFRAICFGFDQSYAKTGIAISGITNEGKIKIIHYESVWAASGPTAKIEYRKIIHDRIRALMRQYRAKSDICYCLAEAIRVHSGGGMLVNNHLSWGALIGSIADTLYRNYEIPLRVVDTRAWKSKVVGTSKPADRSPPSVDPKKWPTVRYCLKSLNILKEDIAQEVGKRARNFAWEAGGKKYTFDTDMCDAICISIYGLKTPINSLKLAP